MKVVMRRRRLFVKFLGSAVFAVPGLLALLFGVLNINWILIALGIGCMFFVPIFFRAAIYLIKPKVVFVVEDGWIKSDLQSAEIESLKGFYHFWRGSSSYLGLLKKDDTEVDIELFNMVEPEDYSDELKKYIPNVEPNWEDEEEVSVKF
ncbi:hypothetical protein J7E38_15615 [Bacillus sp. ISL-35]|uniref:DUF5381 family protein n=1 Tax=Bacillus sp. ISL-35 TaxID=2819122 RepID=UPI001BEC38AC|nr:DUF5381 family protein [Bacillus sp. ISL-35]MBT2680438.1 hypothetical protein [Bacillus sp. ISL-35]MBT2704269.1 hypothetical protein [Chryseobacterium sp. ISL-80]